MVAQKLARILVPLDGSHRAEGAVPYAISIANGAGAELLFVAVLPLKSDWPIPEIEHSLARARLAAQRLAKTSAAVLYGDPMVEITRLADEGFADLIVMTTRGLTGKARRVFGSVAERILITSSIPVLAVKALDWAGNIEVIRRVDQVVVPVDGTNRTPAVEKLTLQLAVSMKARVTIYHVRTDGKLDTETIVLLQDAMALKNIQVEFVVEEGDPGRMLSHFVASHENALVVMCRRGPGRVNERMFGSVSDFLIKQTSSPVIVVPPAFESFEVEQEPDYLP